VERGCIVGPWGWRMSPRISRVRTRGGANVRHREPLAGKAPAVTLAFFFSPRSGRSRRVEGYLAQVLQGRLNHHTFKLVRVDVDKRPDLATRFRVTDVPTLAVISDKRLKASLSQPSGCRAIRVFLAPWLRLGKGAWIASAC